MKWQGAVSFTAACVLFAGCDKAATIFSGAGLEPNASAAKAPGGPVDSELGRMVKRSDTGVGFRRDLPFPTRVDGRLNITMEYKNFRVLETTLVGKESRTLNHTIESEKVFHKEPGIYAMTLEKNGRAVSLGNKANLGDVIPDYEERRLLESQSLRFVLTEQGWKPRQDGDSVDFRRAVWSDSLKDSVPKMMVESGAHPRTQWFSSSRYWKPGDRIVLTGSAIKMIEPNDATGRLELIFQGEEAIAGHPCGVFRVSGDVRINNMISMNGDSCDTDIYISEGKIWASLLHPVLLREEYETLQSLTPKNSSVSNKMQGGIKVIKSRSWEPRRN